MTMHGQSRSRLLMQAAAAIPVGRRLWLAYLSAVTSLPDHNPETELGPCYADIDQALRHTTRRLA